MKSKMIISSRKSQDLFDFLETMRLPEEPIKPEVVTPKVEEKAVDDNTSSPIDRLNDPSIYGAQVPFLIYDGNKETIISRTAKDINEGELNPYEVNWMEVTLYERMFVNPLLESINSAFIMDVAQAIDDEEARHARDDGQYTTVSSNSYGTGQGLAFYYSHTIDNWDNKNGSVTALSIAEGILEKRKKVEAYNNKIKHHKGKDIEKEVKTSYVLSGWSGDLSFDDQSSVEISQLKKECAEWKRKYEELLNKQPENAFNATGKECFTKAKMGLLIYTIASLKDGPTPIKTQLVPIISAIGGWEPTSVNTEMKKAGFNQKDIEAVAKLFEKAMPSFAVEIKKQIPRQTKSKK